MFLSSPFSGSTIGNLDEVSVCGNGPEQGFRYDLGPGERISIQQSNTFDSKHTLRYGGAYPGDTEVKCAYYYYDDPEMAYWNSGNVTVPVYFIVDGHYSSEGGFVLEWTVDTPGSFSCGVSCLLTGPSPL